MFHERHLFRRGTVTAFVVPGWDMRAGFSPRRARMEQASCRAGLRREAALH